MFILCCVFKGQIHLGLPLVFCGDEARILKIWMRWLNQASHPSDEDWLKNDSTNQAGSWQRKLDSRWNLRLLGDSTYTYDRLSIWVFGGVSREEKLSCLTGCPRTCVRINIQGGKLLFSDAGEGLGKDGKGWVGKGIIGDRVKGCRGKGEGDQGGREGNHWEGKPPRGS